MAGRYFIMALVCFGILPWYAYVALTDERLPFCGERVRGMLLTSYQTESYGLKEIFSVELKNRVILINFPKDQWKIEGEGAERLFELLNTET